MAGLLQRWFADKDPYWDQFVNRPFADPKNMLLDLIATSPGGGVSAAKLDVHDAAAMSQHMLQLAKFWGADTGGVTVTDPAWLQPEERQADGTDEDSDGPARAQDFPNTIVCAVRRDFDPGAQGMGGRHAEQRLLVVTFNLRSYIREIGYNAIFAAPRSTVQPALAAGLGTLNRDGRFVSKEFGDRLVLGQVVLTNLPLRPAV